MKVVVETQNADKPLRSSDAAAGQATPSPCIAGASEVMETVADQSWTDFCSTLQRPALLLGDVDTPDSEQP